jgi:glycosyltransferase involved in cell wall biosynthesis
VIVIDDNSDKKCNHLLSKYKSLGVDIRLLTLTKNRGSGVARQVGIDHSNSPYIMFVDSDDKLYDSNSVEKLINALDSDESFVSIVSDFVELLEDGTTSLFHERVTWVFGKIYRRSFLKMAKIRFTDCANSKGNEDFEFNHKIRWFAENSKYYKIGVIDDITYVWRYNPNSITRLDNNHYHYDCSFISYVDNSIDLINWLNERFDKNLQIHYICCILIELYNNYIFIKSLNPTYQEQSLWYCKKFYHYIIKPIEYDITYSDVAIAVRKIGTPWLENFAKYGIVQDVSVLEFISQIKDVFDENEIKTIWHKMAENEETLSYMKKNVQLKFMPDNYWN